jgi:hypothetical protein
MLAILRFYTQQAQQRLATQVELILSLIPTGIFLAIINIISSRQQPKRHFQLDKWTP